MGRAEAGTPKAIGIAIKAKGLQKLRWYCQMCQKQCRDENGFKNHCTTDGHMRMMLVFAENPNSFMDDFSKTFEKGYVDLLSRCYGTRRVNANQVYNEYIKDRHHTHMNATIWSTLTDFVKYLGRMGKAAVEETEEGWMIRWINRDPEALRRQEEEKRREEARHSEDAALEEQVEKARAALGADGEAAAAPSYTELRRPGDQHVRVSIAPVAKKVTSAVAEQRSTAAAAEDGDEATATDPRAAAPAPAPDAHTHTHTHTQAGRSRWGPAGMDSREPAAAAPLAGSKRGRDDESDPVSSTLAPPRAPVPGARVWGTLDAILRDTEAKRTREDDRAAAVSSRGYSSTVHHAGSAAPRSADPDPRPDARVRWLTRGLVVKCLSKVDDGRFYKAKGVVQSVEDVRVGAHIIPVATLRMADGGAVLEVGQEELETVLPQPPGRVLLVAGRYRGEEAEMLAIRTEQYVCDVRLLTGPDRGRVLRGCEYEHVCKLADA